MLRRYLSQERRSELKRWQGLARKRFSPVLSLLHGAFTTEELLAHLNLRLKPDFEILMVHSSFDGLLPSRDRLMSVARLRKWDWWPKFSAECRTS
jgi:hypothetical protein